MADHLRTQIAHLIHEHEGPAHMRRFPGPGLGDVALASTIMETIRGALIVALPMREPGDHSRYEEGHADGWNLAVQEVAELLVWSEPPGSPAG